jgi:hypothetical protein
MELSRPPENFPGMLDVAVQIGGEHELQSVDQTRFPVTVRCKHRQSALPGEIESFRLQISPEGRES